MSFLNAATLPSTTFLLIASGKSISSSLASDVSTERAKVLDLPVHVDGRIVLPPKRVGGTRNADVGLKSATEGNPINAVDSFIVKKANTTEKPWLGRAIG